MADENQTLKLPNEENKQTEEEIVQEKEKLGSMLQKDASPDRSVFEPSSIDQSSQSETLVATFHPQDSDVKPTITLEFKTEQFVMSHQAVLTCVTAQDEGQMQIQDGYSSSSMELLPVPIEQSLSSGITPCPLRQRSPTSEQDNDVSMAIVKHENSSDTKMEPAHVLPKSPSPDGYNWRKYGQKPVKSNDSSRSYYRCTYINCVAKKKIERCDHSGSVVEIIYKGGHNHDPPRKVRRTKTRCLSLFGPISSPEPGEGSEIMDCPTGEPVGSYTSTSGTKHNQVTPEQKLQSPKDCSSIAIFKSEEDCDRIPAKRRMKGGSFSYPEPLCKTIKEPKVVVQAAGDVGMAADGYRWRKYGQKMVKGNSNPRSYYKCTSAGCPVRKHVERAADDATIMITYEGKHDHDMPIPKKPQGPLSDALPIMAATAIDDVQLKESEALVNPESSTQCSMDVEREVVNEKAPEFGGGKALESARTLLSIGIELRPY